VPRKSKLHDMTLVVRRGQEKEIKEKRGFV
jgi:hypothetical protein